MNAIEEIATTQPKENSGSDTSLRFEYQKNWGLMKLLELEKGGDDYSIAFDYHDDIIVFNKEREATEVDFYQVKTKKNGSWRLSEIFNPNVKPDETEEVTELTSENQEAKENVTKKTGLPKSYIAKLLYHSVTIKTSKNFFFVTNRQFMPHGFSKSGGKQLSFSDIKTETQKKIKDALLLEIPELDVSRTENFYILQDQLPLDKCEQTMRGTVRDFLKDYVPQAEIDADDFYETLLDQVIRKRNDFSKEITDTDSFIEKKCFSKSQFSAFIKKLVNLDSFNTRCQTINQWLAGLKPYEVGNVLKSLKDIKADIMAYGNMSVFRMLNTVREVIDMNDVEESDDTFVDYAKRIVDILKDELPEAKAFDDNYLIQVPQVQNKVI